MSKRLPTTGKRTSYSKISQKANNGENPSQLEERQFRYTDQMERWRQEYERSKQTEERLADMSKLSYDPVDYAPLLVRAPWKERPLPDFSYLVDEAKTATEGKYYAPMVAQVVVLAVSLMVLIFSKTSVLLWISGVLTMSMLGWLVWTIQERQKAIEAAISEARQEIQERVERERSIIEEAKKQHEALEDERIAGVESLLAGNLSAIVLCLDSVLPKLGFPILIDVNIDVYENVPVVKVWLPSKDVIPTQTCELLPSGRIKYIDKEPRAINKQYIELCAAIIIQIMSAIYAHIPSFEHTYVRGLIKNVPENDCVVDVQFDRERIAQACQSDSGLPAIQQLEGNFEVDTMLNFKPVEVQRPEEWGDVSAQQLYSMHFKVFK